MVGSRIFGSFPVGGALVIAALAAACAGPPAPAPTPASQPTQSPATAQPAGGAALDKVSLRTGWVFSGYDAPYFVATEKGFYKEAGLDVTLAPGKGSQPTLDSVAGGNDTFGVVDGSVLAIGVQKGKPVKMIAGLQQVNPQGLAVPDASAVKTPKDLAGKRIGVTPGSNTALLLPNYLRAVGVDPASVQVINTDPGTRVAALTQNRLDVITLLANQEPFLFAQQGIPLRSFLYADAGINTLGLGLVASQNTLSTQPDLVRRYLAATMRGWQYAQEHPDEAAAIEAHQVTDTAESVLLDQLKATFPLLHTPQTKDQPLGWMAPQDWQATIDTLVQIKALDAPVAASSVYTNEFLKAP